MRALKFIYSYQKKNVMEKTQNNKTLKYLLLAVFISISANDIGDPHLMSESLPDSNPSNSLTNFDISEQNDTGNGMDYNTSDIQTDSTDLSLGCENCAVSLKTDENNREFSLFLTIIIPVLVVIFLLNSNKNT